MSWSSDDAIDKRQIGTAGCGDDNAFNDLVGEYWKLVRLEDGMRTVCDGVVAGCYHLKFAEAQILEILDQTDTRQMDLVAAITKFEPKTVEQLKAKTAVLLRCYDVEPDDVQGALVRSVAATIMTMPLRAASAAEVAPAKAEILAPVGRRTQKSKSKGYLNELAEKLHPSGR